MRPCHGCPLADEGLSRFGAEKAEAVNAEVQRQLGGDSLRGVDDPTPEKIIRCAAFVAINECGNFVQAPGMLHLKVPTRKLNCLGPQDVGGYL